MRRTLRIPVLLAGVWIVASCTEPAGPAREGALPDAPLFSLSATGITLNKHILSFGQSGTLLIKGFNPISPDTGDAVIATFAWVGPPGIIDSVVDVMTTGPYTHVQGNPYTLVKEVSAGGITMATYVATNIQNFPSGQPEPTVYAVAAYLRQSVPDAGVRLSSWKGVENDFALALGSGSGLARTASGTGTTPTAASAGSLTVNSGGLVYGVSVATPLVGVGHDPAYSSVSSSGGRRAFLSPCV